MKTHLVAAFGITLSVALGAAVGCSAEVDPQGISEETAVQGDALTLLTPHYFTVRRDLRRCRHPLCGGWFVKEANTQGSEVYVAGLDFSRALLGEGGERDVLDAPDREVFLRGDLGVPDRFGIRTLSVFAAFRGMPGIARAPDDGYYAVRCLVPSCASATAYRLGTASEGPINGVSVDGALAPWVSGAWLVDRVEHHGAVVAGHVAPAGLDVSGNPASVLEASQVFVKVPDAGGLCTLRKTVCAAPLTPTFTRDADLCLHFAACVPERRFCSRIRPICAAGYSLTTWPAGDRGCPAFACDPAFLAD